MNAAPPSPPRVAIASDELPTTTVSPPPGTGRRRETRMEPPSAKRISILVGLLFLAATFTFAAGNSLIHSHFSNANAHNRTLIAGLLLLGATALAVVVNGVAMHRVLSPHAPLRSHAYVALRTAECLTIVAIILYFLTSRTRWDAYLLAVYAVSGAAGLVLSSALWTSRIVPKSLTLLGIIGYPIFVTGTILAMFHAMDVTRGAGIVALVPGGLFELLLPIWLFTKGFSATGIEQ
jgi:hypothetical protein